MAKQSATRIATKKFIEDLYKKEKERQKANTQAEDSNWYWNGVMICGVLTFIGIWIYAVLQWGLLIGLLVGWLPAVIGGLLVGFLWPVIAFLVAGFIVLLLVLNK